jgi:MarR family 2-MHQ and catechol resistance regulon transcriptional repressor
LNLFLDIKHLYNKRMKRNPINDDQATSGIHLWLVLWKATRALEIHAVRSVESTGLCLSDFGVLEALLHKGPLAVHLLGEKVLLTSGSMTAAIDRLERRGLVRRGADPKDRRSRIVTLTPSGRQLIERLFAAHAKDMEQAVEVLSGRERVALAGMLRKLGHGAEELATKKTKGAQQ